MIVKKQDFTLQVITKVNGFPILPEFFSEYFIKIRSQSNHIFAKDWTSSRHEKD